MAYLSLDPIITDWIEDNDLAQENISKSQLKRWAIDIIKDFTTVDMYKHKIALLKVHNTKVELPKDFKQLISIAYRIYDTKDDCTTVEEISEFTQKHCDDCELTVKVSCGICHKDTCDCNSKIVEVDIDRMHMMYNPWYYDASKFAKPYNTSELYRDPKKGTSGRFKLMAHATNPFFNVSAHIPDCINLKCSGSDKRYTLHSDTNVVETDITEPNAELLIAYLSMHSGSDGDPKIPDNTNAIEAVEYQLSYKYYRMKFAKSGDKVFQLLYSEAAQRRDIAVGRLKTEMAIPNPDEFRAHMSQIMKRPRTQAPTRTYSDKDIQNLRY